MKEELPTSKEEPAKGKTIIIIMIMILATHSSILAWRNPWTEEPGRLQPTGLHRVGPD